MLEFPSIKAWERVPSACARLESNARVKVPSRSPSSGSKVAPGFLVSLMYASPLVRTGVNKGLFAGSFGSSNARAPGSSSMACPDATRSAVMRLSAM